MLVASWPFPPPTYSKLPPVTGFFSLHTAQLILLITPLFSLSVCLPTFLLQPALMTQHFHKHLFLLQRSIHQGNTGLKADAFSHHHLWEDSVGFNDSIKNLSFSPFSLNPI